MKSEKHFAALEGRLRTMRILWGAFLITMMVFVVIAYVAKPPDESNASEDGSTLFLVLLLVSISSVLVSYVVKQLLQKRAVGERRTEVVQQALIVALVMCEGVGLLGMVSHFITGHRYSFLMFALAIVGELGHFPRREPLLAAT